MEDSAIMRSKPYFLIVLLTVLMVSGCSRQETIQTGSSLPADMQAGADEGEMGQKVLTFSFAELTNEGEKKMEVEGESADIFADFVQLFNIQTIIHGSKNDINITSKAGSFNRVTHEIKLVHEVVAVTDEGTIIETDSLDYDSTAQVGRTEDFTKITREDMVSTGVGAFVDYEAKSMQLKRQVRVEINNPDSPTGTPTVVTCDGLLEVFHEQNVAYFNENVVVVDERGILKGDRMEVYIDPQEKAISRIICMGRVNILQGGNQTFSEKAVYLAKEGRVVLTGSPRLTLYTDQLKESDAIIRDTGPSQEL
jgi:LPS export ABC transporter protein LptC